jgi:VWFA-related protein
MTTFVALAASAALVAQERPVQPVFESRADLVLLDMVVRDQRGRFVTDLRADEIQVYEEGTRRAIESFRWVGPDLPPGAADTRRGVTAPGPAEPVAAPPLSSIVVLAFDPLTPPAALAARKAAIEFLGRPFPANTTIAIVKLGARFRLVQPFTEHVASLRKSVEAATIGERRDEPSTDPEYDSLTDQAFAMQHRLATARPSALNAIEVKQLTMQVAMLRGADLFGREARARESLHSLLAVIHGLATVQGRKTVLFFSEGLHTPPEAQALFVSTLGQANRANVTFYAIDASGLEVDSPMKNVPIALDAAVSVSQDTMGDPHPKATFAVGGGNLFDIVTDALRLNIRANMGDLAESTGGFLIADTNDLGAGIERVAAELRNFYELAYTPVNAATDGHFRKIDVKVSRPGVTVHTRRGYYALPPGAVVVEPYELPLMQALERTEPARDFDHRSAALCFGTSGAEREVVVFVEVPPAAAPLTRLALLAVVKDDQGRLRARLSHEEPPLPAGTPATPRGARDFKRKLTLGPGRYTVETAVQDRPSGRVSVFRSPLDVPAASDLSLGALTIVKRTEPVEDVAGSDPMVLEQTRLVPDLAPVIDARRQPELPLFLNLYSAGGEAVELTLEFRRGDALVGRSQPSLPPADAQGRIALLAKVPVARFSNGSYEVWAVARRGSAEARATASFDVTASPAPGAPAAIAPTTAPSRTAEVASLLADVGRYVSEYGERFRDLVAEEQFTQWEVQDAGWMIDAPTARQRVLRSDLVFVRLPGALPWGLFRDVYQVDGQEVRERKARLESIFLKPSGSAIEQANAILQESARHNLGHAYRTVNVPTLALLFLLPANQHRFEFVRGKDERRFGTTRGVELRFNETARPTLVRDSSGKDLPAKGRFWIDPFRGTVLRSETSFRFEPNLALASIVVEYRVEPSLALWVPSEMKERYEDLPYARQSVFGLPIDGTARYSKYRRFTVATEETVRQQP